MYAMEDLEVMKQELAARKREIDDQVQAIRQGVIKSCPGMFSGQNNIGVKRMGEIDELWNFKDNREATLLEIASCMWKDLKSPKPKL